MYDVNWYSSVGSVELPPLNRPCDCSCWNATRQCGVARCVTRQVEARCGIFLISSSKCSAFFFFLSLQAIHQLYSSFFFNTVRHQTLLPAIIHYRYRGPNAIKIPHFFCVAVSSRPVCHSDWRCSEVGFSLFLFFCSGLFQSPQWFSAVAPSLERGRASMEQWQLAPVHKIHRRAEEVALCSPVLLLSAICPHRFHGVCTWLLPRSDKRLWKDSVRWGYMIGKLKMCLQFTK